MLLRLLYNYSLSAQSATLFSEESACLTEVLQGVIRCVGELPSPFLVSFLRLEQAPEMQESHGGELVLDACATEQDLRDTHWKRHGQGTCDWQFAHVRDMGKSAGARRL